MHRGARISLRGLLCVRESIDRDSHYRYTGPGADGPKDLSNRSAAYNLEYHLIPAIERTHPLYIPREYSLAIVKFEMQNLLENTRGHFTLHRLRSPCNSIRSFIVAVV